MTPKQEAFVREYLVDLNATQAYIRAGYAARGNAAEVSASQLLRNPKVAKAVAEAQRIRAEQTKIDANWVLQKAIVLHDKAMEQNNLAVARSALDLVGKHVDVQAFKDRVEHSGRIEYSNLSDDEIEARIAAHEKANAARPTAH